VTGGTAVTATATATLVPGFIRLASAIRGSLGRTARPKAIHRPRQTPAQTVGFGMITEAIHPRVDRSLAGGVPHTHPRGLATRAGLDEQASTIPGSPMIAGEHASARPGRHQTTAHSFGAASAGRPRTVAKVSDVHPNARFRPRERLAPRYGVPDNSQQNSVYSRLVGEVLAEFVESTTNYHTQPPAALLAR